MVREGMTWKRGGGGRRAEPALLLVVVAVGAVAGQRLPVAAAAAAGAPPFAGARARALLGELCALGPRVPGSAAHAAALDFLEQRLAATPAVVERQTFTARLPRFAEPLELVNLIARFAPEQRPRVLLAAHWDSRPWADQDPDSTRHDEPVLGANDSGSGCAVLLALAELLAAAPAAVGVDLVFFDGEDAGLADSLRSFCLGSQVFARRLREPPAYAIVLDMVGDRDLGLRPERHGMVAAPAIQRYVWARARRLGMRAFKDGPPIEVFDDHVPLLEAGVPAIDLIDFDYAHWHTVADTPDKCSAESLGLIGELLVSLVYEP